MSRTIRPAAVFLGVLAVVLVLGCNEEAAQKTQETAGGMPATGGAPAPGGMTQATATDSLRAEYMNLQQQLNQLQQQAMQDSVLQKEYADLQEFVDEKMKAEDPKLQEHRDRLGAIQQEITAAQQAQDDEKFQALLQEGTALQDQLRTLQTDTMALEEVKSRMDAFREKFLAKMTELNPKAQEMVDRANEISEKLSAEAQAQAPPPPPTGDEDEEQ